MKHLQAFFCILSVFISGTVSADNRNVSPDSLVTLSGLLKYARSQSLQMKSAELSVHQSELDLISTRSSLYPTARAGVSTGKQFIPERRRSTGASIGADVDITPSEYYRYKAGKQNMDAARQMFLQQENDLVYSLISGYIRTIEAMKLISIEQNNIDYHALRLNEIHERMAQGAASKADLLQQKANYAEANVRLLQKVQAFKRQQLALIDEAGLQMQRDYRVDTLEVMNLIAIFIAESAENSFSAIPEKEEITAQRSRVNADKALVQSSLLGYVPSLALSGDWGVDGTVDDLSPSLRVGASLSIPLFDRKERWLNVKKAQLRLKAAEVELERLKRNTDRSLSEAALDDLLAADRVTAGESRLSAAKEARLAMEERFRVGASTLAELKVLQNEWLAAAGSLVEARFDRAVSRLSVLYESGRLGRVMELLNADLERKK